MVGSDVFCLRRVFVLPALALAITGGPAAAQSRIEDANGAMKLVIGPGPASACYEAALAGEPTNTALSECAAALRSVLPKHERVATYVNRAILLEARGDYDAALADLQDALEREPDTPEVHLNLGSVYLHLEQWGSAEAAVTRALDLRIAAADRAHFVRGVAREELGDIQGAYEDYSAAATLAPDWDAPRLELQRFRRADTPEDNGS